MVVLVDAYQLPVFYWLQGQFIPKNLTVDMRANRWGVLPLTTLDLEGAGQFILPGAAQGTGTEIIPNFSLPRPISSGACAPIAL